MGSGEVERGVPWRALWQIAGMSIGALLAMVHPAFAPPSPLRVVPRRKWMLTNCPIEAEAGASQWPNGAPRAVVSVGQAGHQHPRDPAAASDDQGGGAIERGHRPYARPDEPVRLRHL
jgi:hypothetical protein